MLILFDHVSSEHSPDVMETRSLRVFDSVSASVAQHSYVALTVVAVENGTPRPIAYENDRIAPYVRN